MKCKYCSSETGNDYCDPDCKQRYEAFERYEKKYSWVFIVCVLLLVGLLFSSMIFSGKTLLIVGLVFFLMGLLINVFPFVTPETIDRFGVKRSVKIGRIVGAVLIVVGALLLGAYYLD